MSFNVRYYWKGFAIFCLNSNLINTIYECYHKDIYDLKVHEMSLMAHLAKLF